MGARRGTLAARRGAMHPSGQRIAVAERGEGAPSEVTGAQVRRRARQTTPALPFICRRRQRRAPPRGAHRAARDETRTRDDQHAHATADIGAGAQRGALRAWGGGSRGRFRHRGAGRACLKGPRSA